MEDNERHNAIAEQVAAANNLTPKEPVIEAPVEVTPPVESESVETEEDLNEDTDSGDDPTAPRKNKGVGKRINELTREKYEERRRAEHAEQVARELQQQLAQARTPPKAPVSENKPRLEDFDYDQETYFEALADWKAQERLAEFRATLDQQRVESKRVEQQTEFQKRIAELEKDVPGAWQQIVTAPIATSETMLEVIGDSKIGPRIAYYLAQNLDEANDISQMSPARQAAALGRIEERLAAKPKPAPKTVTNAPAPVPVLQSAAKIKTPLADQTIEDRIAHLRDLDRQNR